MSQGIPFEQYMQMTNMDEEKLLEEAMGPAVGQVRMDLAVTAIVKEENIEVSDEEVEAEIAKMAEQYGMDVERVKQFVNPELIKEEVARRKAVSLVVDSAVAVKPEPKEDEGEEKKKRAKKESAGEAPESAE